MIRRGDRIENPVSGEAITFLQTSAETDGTLLQMDICVAPGGKGLPAHCHPKQEEKYHIRSGWIKMVVNGEERYFGPGEDITIPPGTAHQWSNARRNEKLEFTKEMRPALKAEEIYETVGVLGQLGELNEEGVPSVMQLSVIHSRYPDVIVYPESPVFLQKVFFKFVSLVARIFGYRSYMSYKELINNSHSERANPIIE